jgi:hypothetical protein
MKVLAVLVVLVLLVLLAVAVARWVSARGAAGERDAPWELEERSDGELVSVLAVHPANEPLLIGAVPFASADFEMRIEEVRAEGRSKLVALNSGRRELRR